jgi:3-phosphoshikimate 1-carboxyvinyltransferase
MRVLGGVRLEHGVCETLGDHRLAMSLAVAGLVGPGVDVVGADCADVSYPTFWRDVRSLGGTVDGLDAGVEA